MLLSGRLTSAPQRAAIQAQLRFKHLTINEGLSHNKVNAICQDLDGFIWFGTNEGLNRYDGRTVVTYKHIPDDSTSLTDDLVKNLVVDEEGDLWIGVDNRGLMVHDRIKNRFIEIKYNHGKNHFNATVGLFYDLKGKIWTGSADTLICIDSKTNQILGLWHFDESPQYNRFLAIYEDSRGNLWIGTQKDGLYLFNQNTEKFISFRFTAVNPSSISSNFINTIYEDRQHRLWIGTNDHGLNQFNYQDSTFIRFNVDKTNERSQRVRSLIEDGRGNLWIATRAGLYLKNRESDTFYRYAYAEHDFSKLGDNSLYTLYIDASEVLWAGSYSGGVSYADLNQKNFVHYAAKPDNSFYLNNNIVFSFCEDHSGNIWVGTENGGLNYLDRATGRFTYFTSDAHHNSVSSNNIKTIVIDDKDNLWIGTYQGGLNYLNTKTGVFTHFKHTAQDPNSLMDNNIYALHLDGNNQLWIATTSGLDLYQIGKNRFVHHDTVQNQPWNLLKDTRMLFKDSQNHLWIGTLFNGLFVLDMSTDVLEQYHRELFTEPVHVIHEDTYGNLWFGGENGIYCLNRNSEKPVRFNSKESLDLSTVLGILEDENKNLWISTSSSGILKLIKAVQHTSEADWLQYDVDNGLQSRQFNYNAYFKSASGELFFGGINGFNSFFPDNIKENPHKPLVTITNLKILNESVLINQKYNNRVILKAPIFLTDKIELSYKIKSFTLEFSAFHFANPLKNTYAYQMAKNENDQWNDIGTQRSVNFINLPPGHYVFRVKGSNDNEIWNDEGASLQIHIIPPFWKTIWFQGLLLMLILAVIFGGHQWHIAAINHQRKTLELKVKTRTKDLQNANKKLEMQKTQILAHTEALRQSNQELGQFASVASHDLQEPLRMVSSYARLLERKFQGNLDKDSQEFLFYIMDGTRRMQTLISDLLLYSQVSAEEKSLKKTDLNVVMNQVLANFKVTTEEKKAVITTETLPVVMCDPVQLERLFQNLIGNAVKYCRQDPEVHVGVLKIRGDWQISIRDNGIGIDPAYHEQIFGIFKRLHSRKEYSGTGIGLAVCKKIVEKQGGKIWVESEEGQGSTFLFTIPDTLSD